MVLTHSTITEHPALELLEQELHDDWRQFQSLHREFSRPFSERAKAILDSLVWDEDGNEHSKHRVQNLIAAFGARVHALIPQLDGNRQWSMVRKGATEDGFRRSARTDFKTFQEFLSHPIVRIAYSRQRIKDARLGDIIVDPEYLSTTLLENLGLGQFVPKKKGMKRAERLEYIAQAIPCIKTKLAELTPLKLNAKLSPDHPVRNNHRGARHPAVGSGLRLYYDADGNVLGTQSPNGKGKKVLYLTDAHGAHRRIDHIRDSYNKEIQTLQNIKSTMEEVSKMVGQNWSALRANLQPVQGRMMTCIDSLEHVSNEHKRHMKAIIEDAFNFQVDHKLRNGEVQRRYNPGAHRARFTKIPKFVDARIQEIASIRSYIEEDQVCIKKHIAEMQAPLKTFLATVENLHMRFLLLDENKPLSIHDKDKIIRNLDELRAQCRSTKERPLLQPYRTFAEEVAGHTERTRQFLEAGERDTAKAEFMNAFVVARIQDLYILLQKFYDDFLAKDSSPDLDQMLIDLQEIAARAGSKEVARDVITKRYNHFWGEGVYHLINGLFKEIHSAREQEDPKKRPDYHVAMRERFRKVDFREIARVL